MCLYPINFSNLPQGRTILNSILEKNGVMLQQYFSPLIFLSMGSAEKVHPSAGGGRWSRLWLDLLQVQTPDFSLSPFFLCNLWFRSLIPYSAMKLKNPDLRNHYF